MIAGMTLKDYFAAQALIGLLAGGRVGGVKNTPEGEKSLVVDPDTYANLAYELADAMIRTKHAPDFEDDEDEPEPI